MNRFLMLAPLLARAKAPAAEHMEQVEVLWHGGQKMHPLHLEPDILTLLTLNGSPKHAAVSWDTSLLDSEEKQIVLTDSCAKAYNQCGGLNYEGPTCCEAGTTCVQSDEWYSMCKESGSKPTPAPSPPPTRSEYWINGTWTTGYWDCCKPSCSWPNKGLVTSPVSSCDASSGEKLLNPSVDSVCGGGSAASCIDNQPFKVNAGLSMGFAAAAVSGQHGLSGDSNCGQCFQLQFVDQRHPDGNWGGAHPDLVGKTMIVQVTNIGYDVNGQHSFDIQIPGAGQGLFDNGCARQFSGYSSADFDCGSNYGGCSDKSGCSRLPKELRAGCEWRFDWFLWLAQSGQTNNPFVQFRRVRCPSQLTDISGSEPLDDADYPAINPEDYA